MSKQASRTQRRAELLAQCQQQRTQMAAQVQSARTSFNAANASLNLIAQIKHKPWLAGGVILAIFAIKPRRISAFFQKTVAIWQAWRAVAPAVQKLLKKS